MKQEKALDKILSKNDIEKYTSILWSMQTFKKFHRMKRENNKRCFPSLATLWRHKISKRPRAHAYQWSSRVIAAFESEKDRVKLVCPVLPRSYFWQYCDPFLEMKILNKVLHVQHLVNEHWRLLKFDCCIVVFCYFPLPKRQFVLRELVTRLNLLGE